MSRMFFGAAAKQLRLCHGFLRGLAYFEDTCHIHIQHHLESKIGSIWIRLNFEPSPISSSIAIVFASPSAYGWVWVPMYARAALPALAAWEAAQKFTGSMICLKIITDQYESITNPQDPCKYGIFTYIYI